MVPFLPYNKLYTTYQPEVDDAMKAALVTGKLILQEDVEEFEQNFAKFLGVKHVVALNSGTDALMLALTAAGVGPGDEVITVSNTFIATIQVIHHLGATPILVDVGEDGLMDTEAALNAITGKTKAIIPVHLSGDVADSYRLNLLCPPETGIKIIDDAAQAIGATCKHVKSHRAGTLGFAGCFSFYPAKVLGTFGDAGALVTNDDAVAKRIRGLRNHGSVSKEPQDSYEFGWNSRMDNVWAAVLNVKLKYLERDLAKRKEIADYYNENLKDMPITLPVNREGRIWQDYIIRTEDREGLNKWLNNNGIGTLGTDLLPNHQYPGLGLDHWKLPVTEKIVNTSIRIPCNHFMTLEEAKYVVDKIRQYFLEVYEHE